MIFRIVFLKARSWFVVGCEVMSRRGSSRRSISNAWVASVCGSRRLWGAG